MTKINSKRLVLFLALGLLVGFFANRYIQSRFAPAPLPSPSPVVTPAPTTPPSATPPPTGGTTTQIPKTLSLKVPFTPQAPTANWDELHNEACEEASSIMAYAYFSGMTDTTLSPSFVEAEIEKLTQYEKDTFGYYLDINSEETARMIRDMYSLQTKIVRDFTEQDIKKELAEGKLVLFPADGRLLGNPNFRQPGPPYHMVVVRGFDSAGFITNDPGTRKGMNYPYTYQTLYNANGEFDQASHSVDTNRKNIIVVWK